VLYVSSCIVAWLDMKYPWALQPLLRSLIILGNFKWNHFGTVLGIAQFSTMISIHLLLLTLEVWTWFTTNDKHGLSGTNQLQIKAWMWPRFKTLSHISCLSGWRSNTVSSRLCCWLFRSLGFVATSAEPRITKLRLFVEASEASTEPRHQYMQFVHMLKRILSQVLQL